MPAFNTIEIEWFGQSMFRITSSGVTVVVDPTNPQTGYDYSPVTADLVFVTHDHFDHTFLDGVAGKPEVIRKPGEHEAGGLRVQAFHTFHDDAGGAERGPNLIFSWEQENFRIAHFGDLGERLSPSVCDQLGELDILMIPVGGVFTIDGEQANCQIEVLEPKIVMPMHYKTPDGVTAVQPLTPFLKQFIGPVVEVDKRPLLLKHIDLPKTTECWVLPYK